MSDARRLAPLDAIRGLAAFAVVLFHVFIRYPLNYDAERSAHLRWIVAPHSFGEMPVYLFFAISGFVILWSVERSHGWRAFLWSRFTRLFPVYWAAVVLTSLLLWLAPLPGDEIELLRILVNLTMLQEFAGVAAIDGAYWSLAVELVFYGWILLLLASGRMQSLPLLTLAAVTVCMLAAASSAAGFVPPYRVVRYGLLQYGPFFAAGIAIYLLWMRRGRIVPLSILAVAACAVALRLTLIDTSVWLGLLALFAAAVLVAPRFLAAAPFLWLGSVSYALYASHQMMAYRVIAWLEAASWPRLPAQLVAIGCALVLAALLTRFVERPSLRWLRTRRAPAVRVEAPELLARV